VKRTRVQRGGNAHQRRIYQRRFLGLKRLQERLEQELTKPPLQPKCLFRGEMLYDPQK
jgi:hypothetical protein